MWFVIFNKKIHSRGGIVWITLPLECILSLIIVKHLKKNKLMKFKNPNYCFLFLLLFMPLFAFSQVETLDDFCETQKNYECSSAEAFVMLMDPDAIVTDQICFGGLASVDVINLGSYVDNNFGQWYVEAGRFPNDTFQLEFQVPIDGNDTIHLDGITPDASSQWGFLIVFREFDNPTIGFLDYLMTRNISPYHEIWLNPLFDADCPHDFLIQTQVGTGNSFGYRKFTFTHLGTFESFEHETYEGFEGFDLREFPSGDVEIMLEDSTCQIAFDTIYLFDDPEFTTTVNNGIIDWGLVSFVSTEVADLSDPFAGPFLAENVTTYMPQDTGWYYAVSITFGEGCPGVDSIYISQEDLITTSLSQTHHYQHPLFTFVGNQIIVDDKVGEWSIVDVSGKNLMRGNQKSIEIDCLSSAMYIIYDKDLPTSSQQFIKIW